MLGFERVLLVALLLLKDFNQCDWLHSPLTHLPTCHLVAPPADDPSISLATGLKSQPFDY